MLNNLTTISTKYQIVIPRNVRDQFKLKPGQKLMFILYQNSMRLVVVPSIQSAQGSLKGLKTTNLREEDDEAR